MYGYGCSGPEVSLPTLRWVVSSAGTARCEFDCDRDSRSCENRRFWRNRAAGVGDLERKPSDEERATYEVWARS